MTDTKNNALESVRADGLTGGRVHVDVLLAEDHTKPNLCLTLNDHSGKEVCRSLILGTIDRHVEFTLHIRVPDPELPLTLNCVSFLDEDQPIDTISVEISNLP